MDEFKNQMPSLDLSGGSAKKPEESKPEATNSSMGEMPSFNLAPTAAAEQPKPVEPAIQTAPQSIPAPPQNYGTGLGYASVQPAVKVKNPKKKARVFIVILCVIALIAGAFAACYKFIPGVANSVNLLVMSPEKYYSWTEKNSYNTIYKITDSGKSKTENVGISLNLTDESSGSEKILDFSYEKSGDENLIAAMLPSENGGQTEISAYINRKLDEYYYKDTAYSDSYLKLSGIVAERILGKSIDAGKTAENPNESIGRRYIEIFADNVKNVERKAGSIPIGGHSYDMTVLSYRLNESDFINVVLDILDEARKDDELLKTFAQAGIEKNTVDTLYNSLNMAKQGIFGSINISADVKIYVNSLGVIAGRDITVNVANAVNVKLGYKFGIADDSSDLELFFSSGGKSVKIKHTCEEKDGLWSGELTAEADGSELVKASYSNIKVLDAPDMTCFEGEAEITAEGKTASIKLYGGDGVQTAEISGDSFKYKLQLKYSESAELKKPDFSGAKEIMTTQELEEVISYFTFDENGKFVLENIG